MKNFSKWTLLAASLLFFQIAYAQNEGFDHSGNLRQSDQNLEAKATPSVRGGTADAELKITKPEGYPAKDVPKEYMGYRIEIMVADSLLLKEDDLFFKHGNVMVEPLSNSQFSYTVGDFQEADNATSFMQQFILPKYKDAQVIHYKNGKRL